MGMAAMFKWTFARTIEFRTTSGHRTWKCGVSRQKGPESSPELRPEQYHGISLPCFLRPWTVSWRFLQDLRTFRKDNVLSKGCWSRGAQHSFSMPTAPVEGSQVCFSSQPQKSLSGSKPSRLPKSGRPHSDLRADSAINVGGWQPIWNFGWRIFKWVLGAKKKHIKKKHLNKMLTGLSRDFSGDFVYVLFSPIRNDPKFWHPPSPRTIPQICLCFCVFLSLSVVDFAAEFVTADFSNGFPESVTSKNSPQNPPLPMCAFATLPKLATGQCQV